MREFVGGPRNNQPLLGFLVCGTTAPKRRAWCTPSHRAARVLATRIVSPSLRRLVAEPQPSSARRPSSTLVNHRAPPPFSPEKKPSSMASVSIVRRLLAPRGVVARSSATRAFASASSDEPSTAFEGKVDTWTERRRAWRRELNAQRKVWAAEFERRAAEKEAKERAERAVIDEAKAERKRLKAIRTAQRAEEVAEEERRRLRIKEGTLRRKAVLRAQKEFVVHLRKTAREEELLKASRNWVTREHLDGRIEDALREPRPMW